MDKTIYVVGHKNPDTDSVCAAISYSRFKQAKGENHIIAAKAGDINPQTEFALNSLQVCAPLFLADVVPRVCQAMVKEVVSKHKETSLKEVLQLMEEKNIRLVPLVDERHIYYGMVSLFDIAHEFRKEANPETCRQVFTSIKHIHESLGGELLCAYNELEAFQGEYLVGAMQETSFKKVLATVDPQKCIIITGDRVNIQASAIAKKVKALIVTGGLPVSEEILDKACRHKVNLLISPYDTSTTVGLVRLSTPAYRVAQNYDGHLQVDDYLDEARLKILNSYNRGLAVLDDEQKLMGVITMADLLQFSKTKLILVDHNEISQAVDGAEKAEIIEIIDHHRLGNPQTLSPILFINQPVGSTCTLIAKMYLEQQLELDAQTAGLLISGIISDTVNLKSPTTTTQDKQMIEALNRIAGLDLEDYAKKLLSAGVSLAGRSPEEIILADFKEYNTAKVFFGVGQIETVGFSEFYKLKTQIIEQLRHIRQNRNYHFAALLVTDISSADSLLIFDGVPKLCRRLGYPTLEANISELKRVISRKKQLLPHLLNVFKEEF